MSSIDGGSLHKNDKLREEESKMRRKRLRKWEEQHIFISTDRVYVLRKIRPNSMNYEVHKTIFLTHFSSTKFIANLSNTVRHIS